MHNHLVSGHSYLCSVYSVVWPSCISLCSFIANKPSSAKNRFIALMLFAESVRFLTGSFSTSIPSTLNKFRFLYFIRLIFYTSGVMLILLYLTAPLLYIKNKFAERVVCAFSKQRQFCSCQSWVLSSLLLRLLLWEDSLWWYRS